MTKNTPTGRPSKLPKFMEAMKKVLEDPRSVILTDTELLVAVNQRLNVKNRVGVSTWEAWKSPNKSNPKSPENNSQLNDDLVEEFRQLLAYSRVEQKMNLTGNMLDEKNKNQWGSSWLLERKFDDLKLKQTVELGAGGITLSIEGGKDIQGIIDTIDIDHEEISDIKPLDEI